MAVAMKCDRCKKFYDEPWVKESLYTGYIHDIQANTRNACGNVRSHTEYDLCPECSKKLLLWLNPEDGEQEGEDTDATIGVDV